MFHHSSFFILHLLFFRMMKSKVRYETSDLFFHSFPTVGLTLLPDSSKCVFVLHLQNFLWFEIILLT